MNTLEEKIKTNNEYIQGGKWMKKLLSCLLMVVIFTLTTSQVFAQNEGYEKYGKIATAVVKEDYPSDELVEYQYVGREKKSAEEVTDTFRFEVIENGKPKFVKVAVTHNLKNNKTLSISVQEE